jgi:hypothetical protein
MTTKLYCVHVYEQCHEYENVKASSPREAEAKVMKREWNGDYENIQNVEVMRQCSCGYDNATSSKKCDDCGKKL